MRANALRCFCSWRLKTRLLVGTVSQRPITFLQMAELPPPTDPAIPLTIDDSNLKIMSYNVNGLRACHKNLNHEGGFINFLKKHDPDIVCLGEVKCTEDDIGFGPFPGYELIFNTCQSQRGYSGTAVLTKLRPLSISKELPDYKDDEGRIITVEYEDFYLINTYVPNAGQKLERLTERTQTWDVAMLQHLTSLRQRKPVIWTGDLNVAHQEIDIFDPVSNKNKTAGFTDAERANMTKVLETGLVDIYRRFYPHEHHHCYTFWSHRFEAFPRNRGWRLDYFIVSPELVERVTGVKHLKDEGPKRGSDHIPIVLYLKQ
eukprot:TRINITY_DN2247_c0_g2_i2.p1 TRINITY_DN2247_c0_g2~~TRINITY_DN2247_c0_g2_i2.p1  ORF type:complete len:316 (-),score=55.76 TRINITY_DN2247_c0_g2_i2:49-996(-)